MYSSSLITSSGDTIHTAYRDLERNSSVTLTSYEASLHITNSYPGFTTGKSYIRPASVKALVEIATKVPVCLYASCWPNTQNLSITARILEKRILTIDTKCKQPDLRSPLLCLKPIDLRSYSHLLFSKQQKGISFSFELFLASSPALGQLSYVSPCIYSGVKTFEATYKFLAVLI